VDKYVAMGLGREAVSFAVLNYGDNPAKACSCPPIEFFLNTYSAPLIIGKPDSLIAYLISNQICR
jgi:hypothetical protein